MAKKGESKGSNKSKAKDDFEGLEDFDELEGEAEVEEDVVEDEDAQEEAEENADLEGFDDENADEVEEEPEELEEEIKPKRAQKVETKKIHKAHEFEDVAPEVEEEVESPGKIAMEASPDIDVQLVAVMGKRKYTLRELLDLKLGSVVDLKRPPNESVDLVANGKLVARGELVEADGKLGVKILKMVR